MPSRRYVAKYGAIRFLSCPGQAGTVSKFRGISGTVWKTRSPTPPRAAKVKLSTPPNISIRQLASHAGGCQDLSGTVESRDGPPVIPRLTGAIRIDRPLRNIAVS